MHAGFLAPAASMQADAVLLLETGMGAGLLYGAWLARTGRVRQHAWCQSSIVLLNLGVVLLTMIPSFRTLVLPRIPGKLGRAYVALATMHATLGGVAELTALYILVAAGTAILPKRWRIVNYKPWMRTVLGLWWLVVILGFATYARWYL